MCSASTQKENTMSVETNSENQELFSLLIVPIQLLLLAMKLVMCLETIVFCGIFAISLGLKD